MVTLSDVAARAGVSVSAVSRVLSDAPRTRVSEATRERIRRAAADLGYRPNFAARALKSARTHVVGLLVPDVTNAIFTELLRGVEEEAHRRGYVVLLARADGLVDGDEAIARLIGEGRVDGVLAQVGDGMRADDLERLSSSALPVVFVNSPHPDGSGSVILDDEAGMRLATDHLLQLGHRRIGLVNGVPASDTARRRENGFRAAMGAAGRTVDDAAISRRGYDPVSGRDALTQILSASPATTAVVVANVNAAYGVLRAARERGVRVPDDLSVVALHEAWTSEYSWPALTTVRMPLRELGSTAMAALAERLDSGAVSDLVVRDPAPALTVRESTSRPGAPAKEQMYPA